MDPDECLIEVSSDSGVLTTESIVSKIKDVGDELALVLFPGVQYYTGQVRDSKFGFQNFRIHKNP